MKITGKILRVALGLENAPDMYSSGISIDSRSINPGDLFFAIRGNNFDGNKFAKEAIAKGAIAAIVDDADVCGQFDERFIIVDDVIDALKKLGNYVKDVVRPTTTFGITGSVGKTTTKLWLNEILNRKHKSHASPGNYNTIYGIPISLIFLDPGIDYCIMEMGSSSPGEIIELSTYLKPDIGIITNIYESHIGKFENISALAKEKMSIIDGIKPGGSLIYDGSSPYKEEIKSLSANNGLVGISVGLADDCDFSISKVGDNVVTLKTPCGSVEYELGENGRHYSYVSACVAASIYAAGLAIEDFLPYFKDLRAGKGRGERSTCCLDGKVFELIDGSYNASPSSVLASLEQLAACSSLSKIAVLGQMLELGAKETSYHDMVAKAAQKCGLSRLIFVGEERLWCLFKDFEKSNFYTEMNDFIANEIIDCIPDGAVVLVKGSNRMRLDILVSKVLNNFQNC
jgi:UDP-N-acetylmuramoyl-tripeptide--D-alanyl-D-alanine ligase